MLVNFESVRERTFEQLGLPISGKVFPDRWPCPVRACPGNLQPLIIIIIINNNNNLNNLIVIR